jgi:Mor family transcriptional regulator
MKTEKIKYSKDFNFFLTEQIGVSIQNNQKHYTFFSRLDGKKFEQIDGQKTLSDNEIKEICKKIHLTLNN